jgi:predicted flap endonuclease-1-like 5' DNA nuclease
LRDELTTANTRIRDLEAANSRLERNLADRRVTAPVADPAPTKRDSAVRSWFYGGTDVLARIRGIDEHRERQLNQLGIQHFRDLEDLPREDEEPLEERLGLPHGTIVDEHWREQAALLREGHTEEHAKRFGHTV